MELDVPACVEGRQVNRSGPSAKGVTRRERLRGVTAEAHLSLEALVEASGAFRGFDAYVRHLRAMLPLHAALEEALAAAGAGDLLADWRRRRKAPLIRADLRNLGAALPEEAMAPVPAIRGHGAVLGTLYVLEGQTLGGAVLARRAAALGLGPRTGAGFLDAYGAARGAMWRGFLSVLEAAELPPGGEAEMDAAALSAFAAFAARFDRMAP